MSQRVGAEPVLDRAVRDLVSAVRGEVRLGAHDRMLYATDASLYQVEPLAVVIPESAEDAVRAVRFCAERGLPVLPRGGGTSLAGQCTARAVVVDLSAHCRGIGEVNAAERWCEAEAGAVIEELNRELVRRGTGLFFAPDPATVRQAVVGGCIGNNAAGARSILYGRTSENVLAIDAALADGARVRFEEGAALRDPRIAEMTRRIADVVTRHAALIRERFPRTVRRNAGYNLDLMLQQLERGGASAMNLAHLLCGSEGTLAVTLGARLALRESPRAKGLAVLGFATLEEAVDAVPAILTTGPSAVELLDDLVLSLAARNPDAARRLRVVPPAPGGPALAALYVEYFAGSVEEIEDRFAALRACTRGCGVYATTDGAEMLEAWRLRQAGEPLLHGLPGARKPITFVEDNAIPVENLAPFVRELKDILAQRGTRAAFYAHASVGVLHVRPLLSVHSREDMSLLREIAVETADLARRLGGVMSGEHGDGRVRAPLLERFYGPELMGAFREVKRIFDPDNRLNPGHIVEPGPVESITATLRVDPAAVGEPARPAHAPEVETYFGYEGEDGFEHAVELCNGAGVCRKPAGGTMCPSYMTLLDERHSTRGRGNALRLAITGQMEERGGKRWGDPETLETLDLCLSCKACKAECPSNVDVARYRAEYIAQGHRAGVTSPTLADRVFSRVRLLNRAGALAPGVANAAAGSPIGRAAARALLGVAAERELPRFERSLFRWMRRRKRSSSAARVVLFGDCFSCYSETGVGRAAVLLLEALGYEVDLVDAGCCGRPSISLGLLDRAKDEAERAIERLAAHAQDERVQAILTVEPSCLSAMVDDWVALRMDAPRELRARLAAKSMLVEEFVEERWSEHPARPEVVERALPRRAALHQHCHQKALRGTERGAALMRRLLGGRVDVLDAGCCGMAGTFGYAAHRYALSMRIGERVLLPAVRELGEKDWVIAPGTSCRAQVWDGARRRAMHPVEAAAIALGLGKAE